MARERARRWAAPEELDIGASAPLQLCLLPGQHLGAQVWHSGRQLARAIAARRYPQLMGARCLELGAGAGVAGLAAAVVGGAASVVLTDKEEMQELLRRNIELNGLQGRCTAAVLLWGTPPPPAWGSFDVVLAADVIYPTKDSASMQRLLDTMLAACPLGSSTTLVLAYLARTKEDQCFLQHRLLPHFDVVVDELEEDGGLVSAEQSSATCQLYTGRRHALRASPGLVAVVGGELCDGAEQRGR